MAVSVEMILCILHVTNCREMQAPAQPRNPSGDVRARRSYPSVQHISLAPLSTRFPVDDDATEPDYFSTGHGEAYSPNHIITSSYIASSSVPTTPGVLSDVRNGPHTSTYLKRKKVSAAGTYSPASDTHLEELNALAPIHHHRHNNGLRGHAHHHKLMESQDNEWLLRAGVALSSTAREEKGQSWLVKRDSSTSLVSDFHDDRGAYGKRNRSLTRRSRSGISTPLAMSRRPSSSYSGSRHTSRLDLRMTVPEVDDVTTRDQEGVVPDFVDESIRNQMAALTTGSKGGRAMMHDSRRGSLFASSIGSDTESSSETEEEEFDEAEMQRITRQRGFGLGSWIDSLVEWTLFSVEDDVLTDTHQPLQSQASGLFTQQETPARADTESDSENSEAEMEEYQKPASVEPAGDKGGWADVAWLLHVARRAL